jgi:hypothetical protein
MKGVWKVMKERITVDNEEKIQLELQKEFPAEDIEWRVGPVNEKEMQGIALAYVTNRAIQSRLDNVFGTFGWKNVYKSWHDDSQLCGLSVKVIGHDGKSEWVTKWDGAENTKYESVKGGLSDSMKRTAVQFGIGRYLYKMPTIWVNVKKRGKNYYITDEDLNRLNNMLKSNKWKEWIKKHGAFDFDASGNVKKDMDATPSGNSGNNKSSNNGDKSNNKNTKSDPATPKQKNMLVKNMKELNLTEEVIEKMDKNTATGIIKDFLKKKRENKQNNRENKNETSKEKEEKETKNSSKKSSTAQKAIENKNNKKTNSSAKATGGKISESQLQYIESQLNKCDNKDEVMNKLCNEYNIKELADIDKSMFSKISMFVRKSA